MIYGSRIYSPFLFTCPGHRGQRGNEWFLQHPSPFFSICLLQKVSDKLTTTTAIMLQWSTKQGDACSASNHEIQTVLQPHLQQPTQIPNRKNCSGLVSSSEWILNPKGVPSKVETFQSLLLISHVPSRECSTLRAAGQVSIYPPSSCQTMLYLSSELWAFYIPRWEQALQFWVLRREKILYHDLFCLCEYFRETPKEIAVSGWLWGYLCWLNMLAVH